MLPLYRRRRSCADRARASPAANRPALRRPARLEVEPLEDRRVLTVFANQAFVSTLYEGLLTRTPDPVGLSYWTNQLNTGSSFGQVASGILQSLEYHARQVEVLYETFLGRHADPGGLSLWGTQLLEGAPLAQVKAGVVGSDEFFRRSGGTNQAFLTALYGAELNRAPDPMGLAFWGEQLSTGTPPAAAALQILDSPETNQVEVQDAYQDLLGRSPDSLGLTFWAAQLQAGLSDQTFLANVLGSDEYFVQVQQFISRSGATDPVAAATQFLGTTGMFHTPALPVTEAAVVPADPTLVVRQPANVLGFSPLAIPGFAPVFTPLPPPAAPDNTPPGSSPLDPGHASDGPGGDVEQPPDVTVPVGLL